MRFEAVFATIFSTSLYRFLRSNNRLFLRQCFLCRTPFHFEWKTATGPPTLKQLVKSKLPTAVQWFPQMVLSVKIPACTVTPKSLELSIFIWCTTDISPSFKLSWRYENISLYDLCFGPAKDLFFLVFMQHVACCVRTTSHVNQGARSNSLCCRRFAMPANLASVYGFNPCLSRFNSLSVCPVESALKPSSSVSRYKIDRGH